MKIERATLHQVVVGAGFGSLAKFAEAAKVSIAVLYQANRGVPMGKESGRKILSALKAKGMHLALEDLFLLVRNGSRSRLKDAQEKVAT